jgi:hypothetical protein
MTLEQMERLAVPLRPEHRPGYQVITDVSIWDDIGTLMGEQQSDWRKIASELEGPVNLLGNIAGVEATPLGTALAAVTTGTSETGLWAAATYTPIPANPRGPLHLEVFASFTMTTGTTAGGVTFTPRLGTSTGGSTMGASQATTNTASITGAMMALRGEMTVTYPTGGLATARAYFSGHLYGRLSAAATGAFTENQIFGYTAVTNADIISAATGLFMGVTNSSATTPPTLTMQQLRWVSLN